jgi:glycogen phosphorylase
MSPADDNAFKYDFLASDPKSLQRSVSNCLVYSIGKDPFTATDRDWLHALCEVVRDRLIERWMETQRGYYRHDAKRVYYLSLEFLIGRSLVNAMINIGFMDDCSQALKRLGLSLERLRDLEHDAALGNGGLGRLAACILDSMATLGIPGYGYGIRYEYGMFRQEIRDGQQVELPENWLAHGNPWEFPRPEVTYEVHFGGRVVEYLDAEGRHCHEWLDAERILAQAYDTPIPGYRNDTVNNLRLWSAKAPQDFDLEQFNRGDYLKAVEDKALSENLSKVLYPNDTSVTNRELRLKQQYFFVSASLQDIVRRFLVDHDDLRELPEKVAIQLNDTHPSIAVAELMRLLLDHYCLHWQPAWEITVRICSYTNHTLLPEALETWPVPMMERLLPRHMAIIYEINRHFLMLVDSRHPGDMDLLRRLSLIEEGWEKRVRMAHLAVVGSHRVNGVSALHTRLLRQETFRDFERLFPGRLVNVTNGITPRRWLMEANPGLATLISEAIGEDWARDLDQLRLLTPLADDAAFCERFAAVKRANKLRLAGQIARYLERRVDPSSLFDVQVKRIHEYKRQLLNLLRVVTLYNRLLESSAPCPVARTVLIGGKAAPGYHLAKQIIHLIYDVGRIIEADTAVAGRLRLLFVPNYDVTTAADIIPAAELSQQISTAGFEASGTGNMKLALNGALTMGTMDGANIEIRERVGADNIFVFGLVADQVEALRRQGYRPRACYEADPELRRALDQIGSGYFSPEEPDRYRGLVDGLLADGGDRFMVLADFRAYLDACGEVDRVYQNPAEWNRRAVLNTAAMGYFSSDRTVREYVERIWYSSESGS